MPNWVVAGDVRDGFTYAALNRVFQMVQQGMPLVGIGRNRQFREGGQLLLDAGASPQAIESAAGVEAVVIGKPAAPFFLELVRSAALQPQDCLMVGGGGCLVQTGT
jgi:ribonucleotide monophosphatase NagD (HAD superfamily)